MLNFEQMKERLRTTEEGEREPVVAFAQAGDDIALEAAKLMNDAGIGTAILCGDEQTIRELAPQVGLDLSINEIVDVKGDKAAAKAAVEAVVDGRADVIAKGHMQTADYLRAILNKEKGLRAGKTLSAITAFNLPTMDRPFLASDCAMIITPTLEDKVDEIKNCVELAEALECPNPKVSLVSAVETVNKNMPDGYDAAVICKMNQRGQIKGCVVDGPLSLDLSLSEHSVAHKDIDSPVAGKADVLIMPSLQAGNIFWKSMTYLAGGENGAVVMGALKPIVLTSRADSAEAKLNSIAMALLLERSQRSKAVPEKKTEVKKPEPKAAPQAASCKDDEALVSEVIQLILKNIQDKGIDVDLK